jgi:hypothetical protein
VRVAAWFFVCAVVVCKLKSSHYFKRTNYSKFFHQIFPFMVSTAKKNLCIVKKNLCIIRETGGFIVQGRNSYRPLLTFKIFRKIRKNY